MTAEQLERIKAAKSAVKTVALRAEKMVERKVSTMVDKMVWHWVVQTVDETGNLMAA